MENWDNLRLFLAVAEAGTVKAAADSIGVSHTTVLRRMDQFEQEIEAKLFKRLQSGYELTDFGRGILSGTLDVRQRVEQLELQIKGQDSKLDGCLRISQPESENINLYPVYAEFRKLYPNITLQITSSSKLSNLKRQEVDVALRFIEKPQDLLVGRCVGRVDFGIYGSKEYFRKFEKTPDLKDLDWILLRDFSKKSSKAKDLESWISKRVKHPKISLQTETSSDIINAACAGIGVGFMSTISAKRYDKLIALPLDTPAFSLKLWVLTHKDLRHTAMVKAFMEHISTSVARQIN